MGVVVTTWAEDCIVRGTVPESDTRLTDRLNGDGRLELSDVSVEAIAEDSRFEVESVILPLEDLCLVELAGARGHPERRLGTVRHRLVAEIGPYVVTGDLHTLRGVKPLTAFRHRSAIVPLTGAVVELPTVDGVRRWEIDTIGLNQHRVAVIRDATVEEPEPDVVSV